MSNESQIIWSPQTNPKFHLWMCRSWKMLVICHRCDGLPLWGIWVDLFLL